MAIVRTPASSAKPPFAVRRIFSPEYQFSTDCAAARSLARREVAGEGRPQGERAAAQVVHADGDRGAFAVLDADPAREARAGERGEDPVVVVEALADHPVPDRVALRLTV